MCADASGQMCRRFLDNGFVGLLLDGYFSAFLAEIEGDGVVRPVVDDHQDVFVGKAVDVQLYEGVGHHLVHQEAVVDIQAEVLSAKVGAYFDVVLAFVGHGFVLNVALEGVCQIEEQGCDEEHGKEEYGVERHEFFMRIVSFSTHSTLIFGKNTKKQGKYCGSDGYFISLHRNG